MTTNAKSAHPGLSGTDVVVRQKGCCTHNLTLSWDSEAGRCQPLIGQGLHAWLLAHPLGCSICALPCTPIFHSHHSGNERINQNLKSNGPIVPESLSGYNIADFQEGVCLCKSYLCHHRPPASDSDSRSRTRCAVIMMLCSELSHPAA